MKFKFMEEITLRSLIDTVTTCSSAGKRYCFILGAGASKASGIKTGAEMAKEWLKEMEKTEPKIFQKWIEEKKIDINDPGSCYSKIYEQRFRIDPASGFIRLQNEMENAIPSPGYYYLAEIIDRTQNKLVITTNFDSLTEDSLYIYKNKNALVITHESLANYIDALADRPTVIKLHRDLFLQPKNKEAEVSALSNKWKNSLRKIIDIFVPIVIGYGGNDGSLMGFLEKAASKDRIIYWCYKKNNPVNDRIRKLLERYRGFLISIDNFDDTMCNLGEHFGYNFSDKTIKKVTNESAEKLINKYKEWKKERRETLKTKDELSDTESMTLDLFKSLSKKNIAEFEKQISKEHENADKYNEIGDEYYFQNNYKKAIEYYSKAIELEPNNAEYYNNRGASYNWLKEYENAIADKTKAIKLKPDNALYYNSRGLTYDWLNEYDMAISDHLKAIEIDPNNADYYLYLARVLCRINDFDNALNNINKAMSLNSKQAVYYNIRGYINMKKAKHNKDKCNSDVLDDLNKAIELNDVFLFTGRFYRDRAEYYLYSNELDKAFEDLQKAISLNKMDGASYFFLARYYMIKGGAQEHERCIKKMKEYRFTPDSSDY